MRSELRRLLVAAACALATIAAGAANASAETMFLEPAGAIEAPSTGSVAFEFEGTTVSCAMVVRGRLNSSYSMVSGTEVGRITSATVSGCSNGTIVFLSPIEWSMVYQLVLGTSPNITGVLWALRNIRFLVESGLLFKCLYEIRGGALVGFAEELEEVLVRWRWLRGEIIRSTQLGISPCGSTMTMTGSMTLRPGQREHIV